MVFARKPQADCFWKTRHIWGFSGTLDSKGSACSAGDPGSIPGLGITLGERNGGPLQHSCLENCTDRGAWRATVQGVTKSRM